MCMEQNKSEAITNSNTTVWKNISIVICLWRMHYLLQCHLKRAGVSENGKNAADTIVVTIFSIEMFFPHTAAIIDISGPRRDNQSQRIWPTSLKNVAWPAIHQFRSPMLDTGAPAVLGLGRHSNFLFSHYHCVAAQMVLLRYGQPISLATIFTYFFHIFDGGGQDLYNPHI